MPDMKIFPVVWSHAAFTAESRIHYEEYFSKVQYTQEKPFFLITILFFFFLQRYILC